MVAGAGSWRIPLQPQTWRWGERETEREGRGGQTAHIRTRTHAHTRTNAKPTHSDELPKQCHQLGDKCSSPWAHEGHYHSNHQAALSLVITAVVSSASGWNHFCVAFPMHGRIQIFVQDSIFVPKSWRHLLSSKHKAVVLVSALL